MCDSPELLKALDELKQILQPSPLKTPTWQTIMISDTQGWQMDYKSFKHVYLWIPGSGLTLNLGEYGTGPVQAQVWVNLGIKPGVKIFTSGTANPVPVILKFSDEVVP